MFYLKITKAAKKDLVSAAAWYNKQKNNLGYEFLEEVNSYLKTIQKNPQLFAVKYLPYHEAPLSRFPYIITYIVQKQNVIVKAIMASKQFPSKKYRK